MKFRSIIAVVAGLAALAMVTTVRAEQKTEKVIDNDTFRFLKITYPPGEHQPALHFAPTKGGSILVALTPGEIEVNFRQNGKTWTEKGHVDVGKVWYLDKTLEHQFTNIGTKEFVFTSTQIKNE